MGGIHDRDGSNGVSRIEIMVLAPLSFGVVWGMGFSSLCHGISTLCPPISSFRVFSLVSV